MNSEDIWKTVQYMDKKYDANFGDWIKNEDNARIIGHNLRKYIDKHKPAKTIVVVKWIVKEWTLRSIILLLKKMIIEDIRDSRTRTFEGSKLTKTQLKNRIEIINGIIYTWNPIFIAEFIVSIVKMLRTIEDKQYFVKSILCAFDFERCVSIKQFIGPKLDKNIKNVVLKKFTQGKFKMSKQKSVSGSRDGS